MSRNIIAHHEFISDREPTVRASAARNPITNLTGETTARSGESTREKTLRERNQTTDLLAWGGGEARGSCRPASATSAPWATSADEPVVRARENPAKDSRFVAPYADDDQEEMYERRAPAEYRMPAAPAPVVARAALPAARESTSSRIFGGEAAPSPRPSTGVVPGRMTAGSDIFHRDMAEDDDYATYSRRAPAAAPHRVEPVVRAPPAAARVSDIFHMQEPASPIVGKGRARMAGPKDNDIFGSAAERSAVERAAPVAAAPAVRPVPGMDHASERRDRAAEYRRRGQGSFVFGDSS